MRTYYNTRYNEIKKWHEVIKFVDGKAVKIMDKDKTIRESDDICREYNIAHSLGKTPFARRT